MMHISIKDNTTNPTQSTAQDQLAARHAHPPFDDLDARLAYHASSESSQVIGRTSTKLLTTVSVEVGEPLDRVTGDSETLSVAGRQLQDVLRSQQDKFLEAETGDATSEEITNELQNFVPAVELDNSTLNHAPAALANTESIPTVSIPATESSQNKATDPDEPPPQNSGEVNLQTNVNEMKQLDPTFLDVSRSCIKDSFHNKYKTAYVSVEDEGGYYETLPVRSKKVESFFLRRNYEQTKTLPTRSEVCKALDIIEAEALFNAPEKTLHVRLAKVKDATYIDLGDSDYMQVKITAKGRRFIHASKSPVKFIRPPRMQPMPRPVEGGSIELLGKYINVRDRQDFALIVAWILGAFNPDGPFPLLGLIGEQGSGKTLLSELLVDLVDPSDPATSSPPRSARDQMVAAMNGHLQCYDNLSSMPDWFSDALCRQATGVGFITRTLRTNVDETISNVKKPAILNGISGFLGRHDLIDRMIVIVLSLISKGKRRREVDIRREWRKDKPAILGAIFKALSAAIKNQDKIKVVELPRMADFAHLVCAAEEALPWESGYFKKAYDDNRSNLIDEAMEDDVVGFAVHRFVKNNGQGEWSGEPSKLLAELNKIAPPNIMKSRDWPKRANVMSGRLRRVATFLREKNIEVEFSKSGKRNITLKHCQDQQDPAAIAETMAEVTKTFSCHEQFQDELEFTAKEYEALEDIDNLSDDSELMEVAA